MAPHSAGARQFAATERWARHGYWDDLRMRAATIALEGRATQDQARALAEDLKHADGARGRDADTVDRAATVRAATLEALSGPWNAPVRFLGRYRTAAWGVCAVLCVVTNTVVRQTGVVDSFSQSVGPAVGSPCAGRRPEVRGRPQGGRSAARRGPRGRAHRRALTCARCGPRPAMCRS